MEITIRSNLRYRKLIQNSAKFSQHSYSGIFQDIDKTLMKFKNLREVLKI